MDFSMQERKNHIRDTHENPKSIDSANTQKIAHFTDLPTVEPRPEKVQI